jgi:ABC-type phosphate transport system ATPase subunit
MERHIPYLLLKMVFLAFETLLSPSGTGEKTFLSTLNVMILQMVRNECVRFGGHIDIEVSYKILRLNVLKETQNLHNLSCFE